MDYSKFICILLFVSLAALQIAYLHNEKFKVPTHPLYNYSVISIEKRLVNDLATNNYQRELEIELWDHLLSSCVRVVENTLAF